MTSQRSYQTVVTLATRTNDVILVCACVDMGSASHLDFCDVIFE